MFKTFEKISKGELMQYEGKYCNITLPSGEVIYGGKIHIADFGKKDKDNLISRIKDFFYKKDKKVSDLGIGKEIVCCSYSKNAEGGGTLFEPFPFSYILYDPSETYNENNNDAFEKIEIEI